MLFIDEDEVVNHNGPANSAECVWSTHFRIEEDTFSLDGHPLLVGDMSDGVCLCPFSYSRRTNPPSSPQKGPVLISLYKMRTPR